jgi:hypothetical protein
MAFLWYVCLVAAALAEWQLQKQKTEVLTLIKKLALAFVLVLSCAFFGVAQESETRELHVRAPKNRAFTEVKVYVGGGRQRGLPHRRERRRTDFLDQDAGDDPLLSRLSRSARAGENDGFSENDR